MDTPVSPGAMSPHTHDIVVAIETASETHSG
ncbi:hypothetical protein P3T35_004810 [Kitasatospora sp. GP30]|nr:hypothetical protein [Kitasatospora sp. GP30]